MISLKDATFLIPVRIESADRALNAEITLAYLQKHLDTLILLYESDEEQHLPPILDAISADRRRVNYIFQRTTSQHFHRTQLLNEMLVRARTPVVINYDVDILLQPEVYRKCVDKIIAGADLIYPYYQGESQRRIFNAGRAVIQQSLDLDSLCVGQYDHWPSKCGHCQFFKRSSYIAGGMENEGFVAYAPEDQERAYRFEKLGYGVAWSDDLVYHMEHARTENSSTENPFMKQNKALFRQIKSLSVDQLKRYYHEADYLKRYRNSANDLSGQDVNQRI